MYLLILLCHKVFFYEYDSILLMNYDYLIPDLVIEVSFIYLMRPKVVPEFFDVDLIDMFNFTMGKHYKCKLPKCDEIYSKENEVFNIKKHDIDIDETPIIVINPFKQKKNSINSDDDILDEEYDTNKYFSNVNIGFCTEK